MRRRLQITSLVLLLVLAFATTLPAGAAEPNGIVAFISDFGKVDHYVGAMTGTALTKFPDANIVNITHQVEQFNVKQGALTTYLAARHFPPGTVFCVAVDPGGASGRKSLALKTETGHYFVGPDNGALTFVMNNMGVAEVRRIANYDWMIGEEGDKLFDYRDILPPAAATLASGEPFSQAGPTCLNYKKLDIKKSAIQEDSVVGEVILIDSYGNMQANVQENQLEKLGLDVGDKVKVHVADVTKTVEYANTYSDVPEGDFLIFKADTDFIEISINMGSAKDAFEAELGDEVVFEPVES